MLLSMATLLSAFPLLLPNCMINDAVIERIDSIKHTLNIFYCCLQTLDFKWM